VSVQLPNLALDVDTPDDLDGVQAVVGPRTRATLALVR
jgi:hypothetical protein